MKTVMDAVNEFKGEWKHKDTDMRTDAIYFGNKVRGSYYYYGDDMPFHHEFVCNKTQFNDLVSQLETNFGEGYSYANYKKEFDFINSTTPKPSQPVFTQEMKDNGIAPTTGMKAMHDCSKYNYTESGDWGEVLILGSLDGEIFFRNTGVNFIYAANELSRFKPIDTRTDKEKAVDKIMNDHEKEALSVRHLLSFAYDKWVGE